jgi:hypothetical protein
MQSLGDSGLVTSFAIVLLMSLAMTLLALRLIPAPRAAG